MCTSKQEIDNINNLIREKLTHTYIEQYVTEPMIDVEKLTILHHIYHHINLSIEDKQKYITTVMLIQIALDTHEDVPIKTRSKREDIEKQLSVLAGDYYSGLYYLYLSELENIDMIQLLANAIQRINEHKMTLHYNELKTFADLTHIVKKIESLLYTKTASSLEQAMIIPIIEEWLLLRRLEKEKNALIQGEETAFISCLKKMPLKNRHQSMVDFLQDEIDERAHELNDLLNDTPIHLIELKAHISESLLKKMFKTKGTSMVEEG